MKWKDVTAEHNGKRARVSAKSTPKNPRYGSGTFEGVIKSKEDCVPILELPNNKVMVFSWYYDVELLD